MPLAAASRDEPSADRVLVAEALVDLAPKMRAAVALHHYAGFTVPQVAEIMGTSQNTIKSNLTDGMARLRAALDVLDASAAPSWRRGDA